MTAPMSGGRRRIDRVLASEFLDDLDDASLETLRELRLEAEQEEVDLSYVRRLIQGRIDIAEAERHRRVTGGDGISIIDQLATILADENSSTTGSGRHLTAEPSRVDEHRRVVERVISDVRMSDVSVLTDEQLDGALTVLRQHEQRVSDLRRQVQTVVDSLSGEIGRRMAAAADVAF
jgi:hypothetical protein